MSKKSRKRNKKILAALALAGGAAMLGRGKGVAQGVSGADKAGFTSDAAYKLPSKAAVAADIAQDVVKPDTSGFQTRFTKKVDGKWMGPGQIIAHRKLTAGNQIPPSMRGGAETAQGFVRRVPIKRTGRGRSGVTSGWTTQPYKKGGRVKKARVTGIAKRGFGRALMKGKK